MSQRLFAISLSLLSFFSLSQPVQALTMTYSDKTQRVAPYFDFRGGVDLPFNLNLSAGLGVAPDLSSFVSPYPQSSNTGDILKDQINNWAKWDALFDGQLNAGYRLNLVDFNLGIGDLKAQLMPYLGYRHLWTQTGTLTGEHIQTQSGGPNYGLRFDLNLPLGLRGYAYAQATTLVGGSYSKGSTTEVLQNATMTLPDYGLGVNWNLPFLNLASINLGYRGFFLPQDLRLSNRLSGESALIHGLNLGANILWFGI